MSILSDEITNDPLTRGYATMNDLEVAQSLNAVDREVNRTSISGSELLGLADSTEYSSLNDIQRDNWLALCGVDSIDPFGSAVQLISSIWTGNPLTIANLQAARTETLSLAQELRLPKVKEGHVQETRL